MAESQSNFDFIADRPVLDFVATIAGRTGVREEKLRTPNDLARWVRAAGLVDNALDPSAADFARSVAAREAMFALVRARIDATGVRENDRRLVNRLAAAPGPTSRLSPTGRVTRTGDLDAVLAVLATDVLGLFAGDDGDLLSWCADPTCTRPFVDRSRGRRRRWCGMKGCGDRAKAAAYRRRQGASPAVSAPRNG